MFVLNLSGIQKLLKIIILGHFLSNLCAIIGGVFTVSGLLDKFIYASGNILQHKTEIGKAG